MSKKEKYFGYFRVLQGRHSEGTTEDGKPCVYGKGLELGDVVRSKSDLSKLNGVGVSPKFEFLQDYVPRKELQAQHKKKIEEDKNSGNQDDPLEDPPDIANMTVAQLKELAAEKDIDITGLTTKPDLLGKIADVLSN